MTHIVHPYAHRLVILRDWKSRWFGVQGSYQKFLKGDVLVREFLFKKLRGFYIADIHMERHQQSMRIVIKTSRAGMLIGRSGEGVTRLKGLVTSFMKKNRIVMPDMLNIDIEEVKHPESNAALVAYMVAEGLEKRMPFRRILKQMVEKVMANRDVNGVKIAISGRLGGAEMGRKENQKRGTIPLQTFRADIDFARERAHLPYGDIGVKVWIYKSEKFDK
ncbi:MAG: 30S ribosomal protein S3 [Candidatus Lloydbacteria bacterium CG22_combo_CG10-13_8_21_14_all_47_15]|uniref:Small ribosomal subunit protein uS3 n=1 Tax=Candidatus Lloydbacteria bacterium CG22_combo_CG10-13_8_21_14_all_47_15 TaxID=1974635 RepID=A0A2H0CV83_9BACT|nr:MAG: 30S ribosomal protein S3 [Candidatus Lloydbacteria bacterium CG22_combo_CG10-13_8_21_14_all_47_15]